jgi:hypothetical protein
MKDVGERNFSKGRSTRKPAVPSNRRGQEPSASCICPVDSPKYKAERKNLCLLLALFVAFLEEILALVVLVDLGVGHDTTDLGAVAVALVLEVDDAQRGLSLTTGEFILLPLFLSRVPVDRVCDHVSLCYSLSEML